MHKIGFNFKKGRIDKSLHPFCGGATDDIRITTRFNENDTFSCFDALMHETGHALYEFGLPKKWLHQPLGKAGGMALHESQSLFIEMQLVKSKALSKFLEKVIKKKLHKIENCWTYKNIYNSRTKVERNFIRVDSDEVHYPLHIIHRFNLELQIIENNEKIIYLPELWNHEFSRIFNMSVKNDNDGCLQDIHWYGGDFGYFPTYSIGAFIAAQLKYKIKKQLPKIDDLLEKGDFRPVIKWLKNNVHNFGSKLTVDEILLHSTGDKLKTKYFKKHIIERYLKRLN